MDVSAGLLEVAWAENVFLWLGMKSVVKYWLSPLRSAVELRLQITSWPHTGGAHNGAKLGSMGILLYTKLINKVIVITDENVLTCYSTRPNS